MKREAWHANWEYCPPPTGLWTKPVYRLNFNKRIFPSNAFFRELIFYRKNQLIIDPQDWANLRFKMLDCRGGFILMVLDATMCEANLATATPVVPQIAWWPGLAPLRGVQSSDYLKCLTTVIDRYGDLEIGWGTQSVVISVPTVHGTTKAVYRLGRLLTDNLFFVVFKSVKDGL